MDGHGWRIHVCFTWVVLLLALGRATALVYALQAHNGVHGLDRRPEGACAGAGGGNGGWSRGCGTTRYCTALTARPLGPRVVG